MTGLDATSRPGGDRAGTDPPAVRTIVRLAGALDAAAAPALRERLIGLLHPGLGLLVLDLSRVSSCDSAGLAVLIGAERRARVLGIAMCLAAPSIPVANLLHLTGLDRNLTICPDLRGALAAEREPARQSPQVLSGGVGRARDHRAGATGVPRELTWT
jgi:anti-anti-sigma factor